MPITVDQDDVEVALVRPLTPTEANYIEGLCEQAIAKLKAALPSVAARVATYETDATDPAGIDPALVTSVLAGVVKRVLTNPDGLWSRTETTGPYSQSETFAGGRGGAAASETPGGLVITPGDLAQLVAGPGVMAGTLFLGPGPLECGRSW